MNAALDPREVSAAQALAADVALGAEREPFDATLDRAAIEPAGVATALPTAVPPVVPPVVPPAPPSQPMTMPMAAAAPLPPAASLATPPPPAPAWPLPGAGTPGARPSTAPLTWPLRVLAVVAIVALLPVAKPFLLPVVLAVLLAIVLSGPVRALHRAGLSEPVGALIVVCAVLLGVSAVIAALAEPASEWMERAPANVAQLMQSLERLREAVPLLHAATGGSAAPAADGDATALGETLKTEGMNLTRLVLGQATGFAVAAVSTVILLYFLLASENWLVIRLMQRVRSRHARLHGLCMGRSAQRDIAHFLLTMLMINVLLGIATGLALWAIGLPNPLLWGTVTAVLNFVPYVGPLVLMAMLLMAGVLTYDSFGMMVAPPLLFLLLNALETYLLSPLIVGKRLDLNPVFVFLSVMFWGWAWGVAGTLVAVPLLLAIRHACRHSRSLRPVASWLERPGDTGKTIKALLRPEPKPRWWRRHRAHLAAAPVTPPITAAVPPDPPPPRVQPTTR